MIHRLALIIGSIAAAVVLGLGLAATGLTPPAAPVDAQQPQAATATVPDATPAQPITRVETKTVYVLPAPKPKVVHVTKHVASTSSTRQQPKVKVVHVTRAAAPRGDDGGEHEGGDD